jgi:serine/threonine protein kinase
VANDTSTSAVSEVPPAPPPVIQAEVLVYSGEDCISKYSITHGEYLIGRDKSCQVSLDVEGVSRHHARLTFQGYELSVEDLGSANGVYIEGVQIALPTRVRPDQQVEIGSARLFIRLKAEASAMLAESLWDPDLGLAPVRAMLEGRKYKVLASIGRGGMGVVHQARDLRIRRNVAMKVIRTASQFSRENVLRFVDEAQLTGQLQHPNIVPVYEIGLDEQGEVFYTMKLVKGTTLDEVLRQLRKGSADVLKKYPLPTLLNVFQKICDAMAYAHSLGVVHRDLKPDNVMLGEYGEVMVMDWGLAKKIAHGVSDEHAGENKPPPPPPDLRGFQTLNGLIVGTPPYIAPEAARGELDKMDPRSDVYVLGAILYAILTLRPPYRGKEFAELIEQIVSGKFAHPSSYNTPAKASKNTPPPTETSALECALLHLPGRRVPEGLAAIVLKAMSYESVDRYQSVAELQEDIAAWQTGFAPKAERAGLRRQFILWAARHKTNVVLAIVFAVLFHVAIVWAFVSITKERDLAKAAAHDATEKGEQLKEAMNDLKGAAPLFADEAHDLARKKDFETALDRIESAIRQLPNNAEYHNFRGNLLQTLLRWDDATEAYETALNKNPKLTSARENLELTKKLLAAAGEDHEPEAAQLRELHASLFKQQRLAEASAIQEKLGEGRTFAGKAFRLLLDSDPQLAPLRELRDRREFRGRIQRLNDGTYSANLANLPYDRLKPFFDARLGMISVLTLDNVNLPDLSMLSSMNLRSLSVKGCRGITDLTPLSDMKLQRLTLAATAVRDLSPLAGMPLIELNLADCNKVASVAPLKNCPQLEVLLLPPSARDIAFLRDMKTLRVLSYRNLLQPVGDFWREYEAGMKK